MSASRFSAFNWALAIFCVPCALWPLALLLSSKFSSLSTLSTMQINLFSTVFGVYPFVLFALVGVLYKLHQSKKTLARGLLTTSFVVFYALLGYILNTII